MLNYLWGFMIVLGITVGVLRGEIAAVSNATINSSRKRFPYVSLCLALWPCGPALCRLLKRQVWWQPLQKLSGR